MTPEGKIKAYMVKLLNLCGIPYIRNNSGMGSFNGRMMQTGSKGAPDLSVHPGCGVVYWVELKAPDKWALSEPQTAWKHKTGHIVYLINSKEAVETFVYCMYYPLHAEDPSFFPSSFAKGARNGRLGGWFAEREGLLDTASPYQPWQTAGWKMAGSDSDVIRKPVLPRSKPKAARSKGSKS